MNVGGIVDECDVREAPAEAGARARRAREPLRRWGLLTIWTYVVLIMRVVAFVAYGFADYVGYLLPGLPERGVASGFVLGPARGWELSLQQSLSWH